MPGIGAAIAGLVGLGAGGGVGVTLVGTIAKLAAGFGLDYVAKALAGRPDAGADRLDRPIGVEVNLASGGKVPRWFILGTWGTAGQLVYAWQWGDLAKTPNAYFVQVIALSHLPVTGLAKVFVDGSPVTYVSGGAQPNRGQAIPDYRRNNVDHLWVKFYDGNQTAADSYLMDKFTSGRRAWTSARVGKGIAYAIVTARWNPKLFTAAPALKFEVAGIPLYDVTKDSTAGGTGTQRFDTPSTWQFSSNPAVMIYNLLRGLRFGGTWCYGLQTVSAGQLPYSSWAAAINECSMIVGNADGSTSPQFRAGGQVSMATEPGEEITELLKACNGRLADTGGSYRIKVGATGGAVSSFTDDALMIDQPAEFDQFPSLADTVNGIAARYVSPEEGWIEKDAPLRLSASYVAADGGRRSIADVAYDRVSDKRQVQRLAQAALGEARRFRRHVVALPPDAFPIEPLDTVAWTSDRNGYTAKLFRVESKVDLANLDQVLGLREVDPSDYDWTPGDDEIEIDDSPIDLVTVPPQAIAGFLVTGVSITGDGGNALPALRVLWDGANLDDVDLVLFEYRRVATGEVRTASMNVPAMGTFDISTGVLSITAYEVRARFESTTGRREFTWSAWLPATTPDVKIPFNALLDSLQSLINSGSAAGKVITRQVTPTPAGFSTLYQITVYGTGAHATKTAGFYLYVDAAGLPGCILDVQQVAIGSISLRQFPFVIEGNRVKLRSAHIQQLDSTNIKAGAITVDQLKAGSVTFDKIVGGAVSDFYGGNASKANVETKVTVPATSGIVQLIASFTYRLAGGSRWTQIEIFRQKTGTSTWTKIPNARFVDQSPENMDGMASTITVFDRPGNPGVGRKWVYALRRTGGAGYRPGSVINAIWLKK